MSPQVVHSLKQAAVMIVLAVLGVVGVEYTNVLDAANVSPLWGPIIGAAVASGVRWFEGMRDGQRAAKGEVVPADVAYDSVNAPITVNGVKYTDEAAGLEARNEILYP